MDENHGMMIISGKQLSVKTSKVQIQNRIKKISSKSAIELSAAKNNFLENFGQKILNTIREQPDIKSADIVNGKLQLSGNNAVIANIKSYLKKTLYEKNVSITYNMKQHLKVNFNGRMWKEFSKKHRVGYSFQELRPHNKNERSNTPNRGLLDAQRVFQTNRRGHGCDWGPSGGNHNEIFGHNQGHGGYARGNFNHGGRGREGFHTDHSMSNSIPNLMKLNLNDQYANTNENNSDDPEEGNRKERYNAKTTDDEDATNQDGDDDDYDDNRSQASDSDVSLSSKFAIDSLNTKNINDRTKNTIEIALCSDSDVSLSNAIAELQSYSLHVESWALTEEEVTFILEQQQRGKTVKKNTSIRERSIQIKLYLQHSVPNAFVHIYVYYIRGMSHVKVSGFKSDVHSAVSKIKNYLNDVVNTEIQIPISGAMAFFLKKKVSSDINRLGSTHHIKIITFSAPRRAENTNDNDNHCLKLVGPAARINWAQMAVENFLGNLSEQEQDFSCETWDISNNISLNIKTLLKTIRESNDYEAVGFVKFYNLATERRQTTPKVTITVVGLTKDIADDVIQQCKDFVEGYVVWKPSLNEYRALYNILLVQRQPNITHFQEEWDTKVQLENKTNTIIIPARSQIIADEIKEALQNLAVGQINRMDKISVTIPIPFHIRRFVYSAVQPVLDEVKTQRVYINLKDWNGLKLHGRSEIITSVQVKINSIIDDIKQRIITNRLTLPLIESELIRVNSYKVVRRIEDETNTVIRDVKADTKVSKLNGNDDTNLTITCVVNSRGQTILIKKGDITKVKDVDAIVNAANGSLYHAGGVDKAISDAAGPALDQEYKQLIAKNGGVAISTGKAVKTTAGNLPYKSVIHAIGPQYANGNQQERPLLFSSILSSLRLAEQEGYNSIALPAISGATYRFPLQDCTNIVIRAVKQFFADFPESHLRKVILLDIDDTACNSFAREVVNDHTNTGTDNDNDIMNCDLPPLTAKWCWQSDFGEKIYDDTHTHQIEDAFQEYLRTFIQSNLKIDCDNLETGTIVCYSIHFRPDLKQILTINPNQGEESSLGYSKPFPVIPNNPQPSAAIRMGSNEFFSLDRNALNNRLVCGYQMRESTGFKRDIIRYPLPLQPRITSVAYQPKPLDTYQLKMVSKEDDWDIIGINNTALKQAEIAIRKVIESAMISEPFSINLNEDIDAHKKAITNIAIQQFIHVDFQQDSAENLVLKLKGFEQNILKAKLQISLYVQDVLRIEADKDDELNIPKEWGEQEEQCKLVELSKNDPDFIRIEKRMKETMSNMKADKIERVQNLKIWNHYAFRRRTLQRELSNKPDLQIEMELFHGTRMTPPSEIYNGEFGFDMTFCTSGLWGIGTYFAANASYSCQNYSYQLPNDKRQVFLAHVLTGEVFDYKDKNDPTLRRTPKKNDSVSGARYNSISGETRASKVYIVYENRVAYPTYLITFSY
ncbi:unnamed protein product [Rotaria sordida]|uniref:Poly [ADP-ribose] polymerase n=1 Tax=Rotaria sordida TaxID=392033 RepID=A0A816E3X6_9BILA|nr:unnamed protein product [Rotaria sordida]CAF1641836.1 unnamed protein product [Rotaria sordida]